MTSLPSARLGPADIGVIRSAPRGQALQVLAGQLYFGTAPSAVRTLLGSCVAITLWHPQRRIGGMCHYLLPQRARKESEPRDAQYGDEALAMLADAMARSGTKPAEYEAHLYGGADTMAAQGGGVKFNVGERNISFGWALIDRYGFTLQGVDVGDNVPRSVALSLLDGTVAMRRMEPARPPGRGPR